MMETNEIRQGLQPLPYVRLNQAARELRHAWLNEYLQDLSDSAFSQVFETAKALYDIEKADQSGLYY